MEQLLLCIEDTAGELKTALAMACSSASSRLWISKNAPQRICPHVVYVRRSTKDRVRVISRVRGFWVSP